MNPHRNKSRHKENPIQHLPLVKEPIELMNYLLQVFAGKSRSSVKSMLSHRQILVNDLVVSKFNHLLQPNDRVSVNRGKTVVEQDLSGIKILFEDDYLVVIEKSAGLLSVSTAGEKERTAYHMLSRYVKSKNPLNKIFVLHRLDRETSGVMMFAKDQEIQKMMQYNWRELVTARTYTAIVEGKVEQPEGTINSNLRESSAMKIHTTSDPEEGQNAISHYKLLKQWKAYAMVDITLETGRKNQIRVHMQELGNPVTGDKKYGSKTNPLHRLCLHARLLVFRHPVQRHILTFESPIPKAFMRLSEY